MKTGFFTREHTRTPYIQLDTRKCKACWECIKDCVNRVISKVDIPFHKHALLVEPDACTGCLNCINTCQNGAYSIYDKVKHEAEVRKRRTLNRFLINNLSLAAGLFVIISGLALQFGFHRGGPNIEHGGGHNMFLQSMPYEQIREIDMNKLVWGFNYSGWVAIHKINIVLLSLLMIYHVYVHWSWYIGVIRKRLLGKNIQVITLTALFLMVAFTGLIPWFIDLSGSTSIARLLFIEIHDKITFILIGFLIWHILKRNKWYVNAYRKLKA